MKPCFTKSLESVLVIPYLPFIARSFLLADIFIFLLSLPFLPLFTRVLTHPRRTLNIVLPHLRHPPALMPPLSIGKFSPALTVRTLFLHKTLIQLSILRPKHTLSSPPQILDIKYPFLTRILPYSIMLFLLSLNPLTLRLPYSFHPLVVPDRDFHNFTFLVKRHIDIMPSCEI